MVSHLPAKQRSNSVREGSTPSPSAMKPHWYFITYRECPVCGRCEEYRERRYTKKPKRPEERRSVEIDAGCYCTVDLNGLGMGFSDW